MFYLFIFFLLVFCSFLELTNISKYKKLLLQFVSCFVLIGIAGFRYETGGDWTSYTAFFNDVEPLDRVLSGSAPVFESSIWETGYKTINTIVKTCGLGIQTVFFLVSLFSISLLFFSIKEYLRYPIVALLIYFGSCYFALDMIAIRQAMAVAIFFYGVRFIYKRQLLLYLLTIIFACLFHRSAILLFPLYFFVGKEFSKNKYVVFFIFSVCIFFFQIKWMTWLLVAVANIIGGSYAGVINAYATSSVYGIGRTISIGILINFFLFIIYMYKRNELLKLPYFNCFFNLFMLNILVYFVFYEFIEIGDRYRYYFLISNIILLPYLLIIYQKTTSKIVIWFAICCFSFLYGRSIFLEDPISAAFNPYQNYLVHLLFDTKSTGQERLEKSDQQFTKEREQ